MVRDYFFGKTGLKLCFYGTLKWNHVHIFPLNPVKRVWNDFAQFGAFLANLSQAEVLHGLLLFKPELATDDTLFGESFFYLF